MLRSWDAKTGEKLPKSTAGLRTTLLPETLRTLLELPSDPDALVFGRTATDPFTPSHIRKQAEQAWKGAGVGLHECRHAFSSFLDAAGVSPDRADRYMGHSRPGVASRYRHLLDGQLQEDNARLDSYLAGGGTVHDLTRAHAREATARQLRDNGLSHAAVLSG